MRLAPRRQMRAEFIPMRRQQKDRTLEKIRHVSSSLAEARLEVYFITISGLGPVGLRGEIKCGRTRLSHEPIGGRIKRFTLAILAECRIGQKAGGLSGSRWSG